jgi:hypothetical protein
MNAIMARLARIFLETRLFERLGRDILGCSHMKCCWYFHNSVGFWHSVTLLLKVHDGSLTYNTLRSNVAKVLSDRDGTVATMESSTSCSTEHPPTLNCRTSTLC